MTRMRATIALFVSASALALSACGGTLAAPRRSRRAGRKHGRPDADVFHRRRRGDVGLRARRVNGITGAPFAGKPSFVG